jgi:hypothetical protein
MQCLFSNFVLRFLVKEMRNTHNGCIKGNYHAIDFANCAIDL